MEDGIFEGLKVLDCASFIAAPAAATVLSDFGAQVIKIEPPGLGDPYRNLPNLPGYPISAHNFAWLLDGRNKRSLALDLSKPDGRAVLYRLATEADVFIRTFRLRCAGGSGSPMRSFNRSTCASFMRRSPAMARKGTRPTSPASTAVHTGRAPA